MKIPARGPIRDPGIKLSRKPENGHFFVTTITLAEILYGIELIPKGKRRDKLLAEAEAMFAEDFAGRILPFAEDAARAFSAIAAGRRGKGRPAGPPESLPLVGGGRMPSAVDHLNFVGSFWWNLQQPELLPGGCDA